MRKSGVEVAVKHKDGSVIATGVGANRKEAEIDASMNALKYFGIV
jgi:dsRNA-specific ribonuclease